MFSSDLFGLCYGFVGLVSQPFNLLNIPMLAFNTENDDYAVTNYILAAVMLLMSLVSVACIRRYLSTRILSHPTKTEL